VIKLCTNIDGSYIDIIDGFIFEHYPSPWVITQNRISDSALLCGYFENDNEKQSHLEHIKQQLGRNIPLNFTSEIIEQDWKSAYKLHFKPWSYKKFHLVPTWLKETYPVPNGEKGLYLDPGMAFGTGNHESTRLCLEFILDDHSSLVKNKSFIDLGCGSGILSLVAYQMGFQQVVGVDNDEDAVRISKENASLNFHYNNIEFITYDLVKAESPLGFFDYILANIQADILCEQPQTILNMMKTRSVLILSGILNTESDSVIQTFTETYKYKKLEFCKKVMGEWTAIKFW
jgi:ribosomal protein L11 methyltransferase